MAMYRFLSSRRISPCAGASLMLAVSAAGAQSGPAAVVTVTGQADPAVASVAGFGDAPLARSPFQATTLTSAALTDAGVQTLGDITRMDASIGDAYNAPGYYATMAVRGYTLDNRFNYRRDGLPINAETSLALDDKASVEVLEGTSGAQAGTSAPGGLVNLVVKRPRGNATTVSAGVSDEGSLTLSADIDRRLGTDGRSGLRVNLAAEQLRPVFKDDRGQRYLAAVAGATPVGRDGLLELEVELSHQSQPSLPGFSLLGSRLPSAASIDPRINLNDQPWSLPVVFDGTTGSLRYTQQLADGWRAVAQAMTQRLRTDDRIAFPYGCSAENNYSSYCSDGSFDLYDFRSNGEHRRTDAGALRVEGHLITGDVAHQISAGVLVSRFIERLGPQIYNFAGVGTLDGNTMVPAAPTPEITNTDRTERSTEWQLFDQMHAGRAGLWLGLRHTTLDRRSVQTDGTQATAYAQGFTTPWLAGTWQLNPADMVYASWGQGVESDVAPNLPIYTNAGQPLPALKSRQTEIGVKHQGPTLSWSLAWFDIARPLAVDLGSCDVALSCTHQVDGTDHHQGAQAAIGLTQGPWSLHASTMWLQARREHSQDPGQNGLAPTNVPEHTARVLIDYRVPSVPGLALQTRITFEGPRQVLADNSLTAPSWTRTGLAARYAWHADGRDWLLRAGIDNLFDRRAWQETPTQYGHVYLYPMAPRTFRAGIQVDL